MQRSATPLWGDLLAEVSQKYLSVKPLIQILPLETATIQSSTTKGSKLGLESCIFELPGGVYHQYH